MVFRMFRNALVKVGIFIANFFNNVARNIKQLLLNLSTPKKEFEANYIRKSFDEIEKLTAEDDGINI